MTLAIGIGLLIAGLSDRVAGSWKQFFVHLIEWILSPKMLLRLSLCILVIALTTTHSRMGNTAFFSSLLIAGVIGIALSRHATRNVVVLLVSLVVLDLAIVGSWFGVEKLAQRLEATTVEDVREREQPAVYAVALIRDYPVFGAGAGSFEVVFPRYRPESVSEYFDHAHNDYAQIAAETGLVGLGLAGAGGGLFAGCGAARAMAAARSADAGDVVRFDHGGHVDPHPLLGGLQPAGAGECGAIHGAAGAGVDLPLFEPGS